MSPAFTRSAEIPDYLVAQLDACGLSARVPESLVAALWLVLQASTNALEAGWLAMPGGIRKGIAAAEEVPGRLVSARFADIRLVARTAVTDPARADDGSGAYFLHANHLALDCGLDFIAAQKPHALEIGGFLQMLMEKNVSLVVDLTAAAEREPQASYAPALGRSLCIDAADVEVACAARRRLPTLRSSIKRLIIRRTFATDNSNASGHVLRRLHFAGWPDHGVIASTTLQTLADQVERLHANGPAPIVVHCMAGVGRTGTLIAFIAARRRLRSVSGTHTTSIVVTTLMETIAQGRRDRGADFVQTGEQFALVLTTLLKTCADDVRNSPVAAGDTGAVLAAARWLAVVPAAVTDSLRQTGRRLRAWLNEDRPGRSGIEQTSEQAEIAAHVAICEASAGQGGHTVADAATATAPAAALQLERAHAPVPKPPAARTSATMLPAAPEAAVAPGVRSAALAGTEPATARATATVASSATGPAHPIATLYSTASATASATATVSATVASTVLSATAQRPSSRPAASARAAGEQKIPGGASNTIAADQALSYCYDQALARLGQARKSSEIDALLAEIVAEARLHRDPGFVCTDSQYDMLKAAVLKRFQRRDKGIIFQAHLARTSDGKADPVAASKSASGPTPVAPPAFQEN